MLHIHRADRADALADALGDLLATPPSDAFTAEVISVPTRGIERWLTQTLSSQLGATAGRTDGIVANVQFPPPRAIVDAAVTAACGVDPDTDPWAADRVLWPLIDMVDEKIGDPQLAILASHLRDSAALGDTNMDTRPRRLTAVRHVAHLFDRYAIQRPAMLDAWREGRTVGADGRPLDPHVAWQAVLWRHLRERIATPSPAERLADAVARLEADPALVTLPDRLALFGLTRLPAAHVGVLQALAAHRDVHLFVLHPSPALWTRVAECQVAQVDRRADDPTAALARNPLLRSWGRDVRELQLVIGASSATTVTDHTYDIEHAPPATLLARLQADVRADRSAPGPPLPGAADERPPLDPADRSVEIHSCHGRARQVEVLRDAILHVLQDDPALQPRDVIVMCPDIEAFAPLIHATFGVGDVASDGQEPGDGDPSPAPDLRVRLADRALHQTNLVLGVVGRLLELADRRMTASEVLDLADREPVRRRFGLDDRDLERITGWIAATEIRWGLDAEHREFVKLAKLGANTWRAGIDRILLGATMTEDAQQLVGDVLPHDDVDSGAIDLAGRFAELVQRLRVVVDGFAEPKTISQWSAEIGAAADLLAATSPRDAWQRVALDRLLTRLATDAGSAAGVTLELAEIRELVAEQLRGRPTRANFRTGHLTFCTLSPMRSIPHPVICLLGLDDDVFPRKAPRDGDDLIGEDPHVGDHDGRSEDRQMLLDAVLAAQDKLIVTFSGNDERTNAPRPPAVPLGELLDVIDRTVRTATGTGTARAAVVTRHPLQPFDPRNFTPGTLAVDPPYSFDRATLEGARALAGPRTARPPFLTVPLAPPASRVVELDDLVKFVQHPARAFLRQRLGISLGDFAEELSDAFPLELDGLQKWAIGERLLGALLSGHTLEASLDAERARGAVPPGKLADKALNEVGTTAAALADTARALLGTSAELGSLDVRVPLGGDRVLSGTVAGIGGDVVRAITYSKVAPKHRLAAWVKLLALTATDPERAFEAVTIGRTRTDGPWRATVGVVRISPLGTDPAARRAIAHQHLAVILDLFDRGMREPAPLACATSAAYAKAARTDRKAAFKAGSEAWSSKWKFDKEDKELEHQKLLDGVRSFEDLLDPPARADEQGAGWDASEPSRFGRWALRLWSDLLDAEEIEDR